MDFRRCYHKVFDNRKEIEAFRKVASEHTRDELSAIYGVSKSKLDFILLNYDVKALRKQGKRKGKYTERIELNKENIDSVFLKTHTAKEASIFYGVDILYIKAFCRVNKIRCNHQDDIAKWAAYECKGKIRAVYYDMLKRCFDEKCVSYKDYGGRGIRVCEEWKNNCRTFYKWAKDAGYREGLQLDRINNNGNYEPSNCHWTTPEENAYNKRNTRYITFQGKNQSILEWSRETGLSKGIIADRIYKRGWSVEEALTTPVISKYMTKEAKEAMHRSMIAEGK